ncbi:S8 family serine peptidase [Arthrobacter tumbae]|uniref:S8 family serine peptidase n=1 Tax=Arthrobacter tumbae TaxID=163874 RepID=UPI00195C8DF8|nr:S8 family serine peptidase [Arthrobacter tumbae]MBM7780883.1 serine protease [Arthrobacter tumbae]
MDTAAAEEFISDLEANPAVDYVEADTMMFALASAPSDSYYGYQWDLTQKPYGLDIQSAWDHSTGSGVVVAVIDSGTVPHQDLDANSLPGYDMISTASIARDGGGRDANPRDEGTYGDGTTCEIGKSSWHGAHVAGTVAAVTGNGMGIAGIAPNAKILPIRALGLCGSGYTSDIIDGITWASGGTVAGIPANANPARVINLSLGGNQRCSDSYQDAIDAAVARGSVIVAAAGNESDDASLYSPASCNNVITVGATGPDGAPAYYSNFGGNVDVSAPGGNSDFGTEGLILSTVNPGTQGPAAGSAYSFMQGTSTAAPHIAGVAALMLSANGMLTPAKVEEALKANTQPFSGPSPFYYGAGIVDAAEAVDAVRIRPVASLPGPTEQVVPGQVFLDGDLRVGETLTARISGWEPAPVAVTYQWFVGGNTTPVSTSNTYTLRPEDLGQLVAVVATGTKDGYEPSTVETVSPGPVAEGILTAVTPVIYGNSYVYSALTVNDVPWGPAPVPLTYQWLRNGEPISGATASSYDVSPADMGTKLSVRVTGSKNGYQTSARTSAETSTITGCCLFGPRPVINGTRIVGHELTAYIGIWSVEPDTQTIQWYRGKTPIEGATSLRYTLTGADFNQAISVWVTGTKAGYPTYVAKSAPTASIPAGTLAAPTPAIGGAARVGSILNAITHAWTAGTTLSYQWLRDGSAISGAIAAKYRLTAEDLGKAISVTVTGSSLGYDTKTVTSAPTQQVLPTLAFGDYSGDGTADVMARDTSGGLFLYPGNGKGGWLPRTKLGVGFQGFNTIIRPGDFDGDGLADYIGRDSAGRLWLQSGYAGSRKQIGSGWQNFTSLTAPGDFNGDGNVDVIARDSAGVLYLYPGNGAGGWKSRMKIGSGWQNFPSIITPGDFNGDGAADVMARDKAGALYLYPGNGAGGWKTRTKIGSGWQNFTSIHGAGDFNGDNAADVMVRDRLGALYLYPGNGTGGWKTKIKVGSGWDGFNAIF